MVRSLLVVSNTRVWSASPAEEAIRIWDLRVRGARSRVTESLSLTDSESCDRLTN